MMHQTPEHDKLRVADSLARDRDYVVTRATDKLGYIIGKAPAPRPDPVDQYLNFGTFDAQVQQPTITAAEAQAKVDNAYKAVTDEPQRVEPRDVNGSAEYA